MNNLHRYNLEVLINFKPNQELKLSTVGEVQNKLTSDDSYLMIVGLKSIDPIEKIVQVYSTSFYHFLNLIQLPNSSSMSSCINLSQHNYTEFQLEIILLLENSLKGLFRYENYCRKYNVKKADYISNYIAKLSNHLVNYKSSVLSLHNSIEDEKKLFMTNSIKNSSDVDTDSDSDTYMGFEIISKHYYTDDTTPKNQEPEPTQKDQEPEPTPKDQEPEPTQKDQEPEPTPKDQEPEPTPKDQEPTQKDQELVVKKDQEPKIKNQQQNILTRIRINIIGILNRVKRWFNHQFNRTRGRVNQ
uniref:Uncharacterized protein n=1 Tax=viral metagenome TaxID=1070528 RepID=A0A6C0E831_9ZZZZ